MKKLIERTTAKPFDCLLAYRKEGRRSLRAQTEGKVLEREEIFQLLADAKAALNPIKQVDQDGNISKANGAKSADEHVTADARKQYGENARRIFGVDELSNRIIVPKNAMTIIDNVRTAKTKSTLRMRARSVRFVASFLLKEALKLADQAQRNKDWDKVKTIVSASGFKALTQLAAMLPADYAEENWEAERRRKGKKSSLSKLPKDWREQMVANSTGQFRLPMMLALMTGCRPVELEKGVRLKIFKDSLYVQIKGAKVKADAGQETRQFQIADHSITNEIMKMMKLNGEEEILVKVSKGNSVTTHMREIGKKLWPNRKETITVYTARHAMAADCKSAMNKGAEEDLVSKVLGHIVDKTASYYGNRFQSGGKSVVPSHIIVPKEIKQKSKIRNQNRVQEGMIPIKKKKIKNKL